MVMRTRRATHVIVFRFLHATTFLLIFFIRCSLFRRCFDVPLFFCFEHSLFPVNALILFFCLSLSCRKLLRGGPGLWRPLLYRRKRTTYLGTRWLLLLRAGRSHCSLLTGPSLLLLMAGLVVGEIQWVMAQEDEYLLSSLTLLSGSGMSNTAILSSENERKTCNKYKEIIEI